MANRNKHGWEIYLKKKGDDKLSFRVKGLRQIIRFPVVLILMFVCWGSLLGILTFSYAFLNPKDMLMIKFSIFLF